MGRWSLTGRSTRQSTADALYKGKASNHHHHHGDAVFHSSCAHFVGCIDLVSLAVLYTATACFSVFTLLVYTFLLAPFHVVAGVELFIDAICTNITFTRCQASRSSARKAAFCSAVHCWLPFQQGKCGSVQSTDSPFTAVRVGDSLRIKTENGHQQNSMRKAL